MTELVERPAAELVREAIDETRELVRLEVALAKDEIRTELNEARAGAIALGASVTLAILGLALLIVALVLAIQVSALPALIAGVVLLACAALAAYVAWTIMPKRPLGATRGRLEADAREAREVGARAIARHTEEHAR